ncbi:MAG: SpoIIE family protein phosphatase [candidate division Zixibacteria bacterium]|jgi:sigma-B regulation protein RsbU (phosphoserine phosphatase)|nr:SpoIIE family protein phosphatase [candidate division Zixibacteria bacterium]
MTIPTQHYTRTEKLLLEAARTFNSTRDYEDLMASVLRLAITAVDCEAALVFRVDHNQPDVKIRLLQADSDRPLVYRREIGESVAGYAARFQEPVIVNDVAADSRVDHGIIGASGITLRSLMAVPLIGKGHMIGVVEVINKVNGIFTATDLDIMIGLNNQMAVAIDNAHLVRELKREALERKLLYDVGIRLAGALELNELLKDIMASMQQVVHYEVGGIFLIDAARNDIQSIYTVGYEQGVDDKLNLKIGQGLVGHVANTGLGVIVPDVTRDPYYISVHDETRSEIAVPIKVGDRVIGVINLESNELDAYDEHSLSLINAFAAHAAISLERARMHESMMAGKRLEEQLNVARTIQQTFLPNKPPRVKGYDIRGSNVSSGQVGGDYFDYIKIVDSQHGLTVADVSGKGVPAALIMASFRASLIAEIRNNYSIRTICQKVNTLLVESLDPGRYVTAVYGVLDSANNIFTYANCGHNLPFLLRADGSVQYLREGGPVLGVTAHAVFEEQAVFLNVGDLIVLYTDGVTEVFNEDGEEFGIERLVEIVKGCRDCSCEQIEHRIYNEVRGFAAKSHRFDDFTLMIIKRLE